jgi:hypothetical protein
VYGNKSKIHHYVAATTEYISLQEMIQGQCIAHSAGAYTATLLVMVNVMKVGGRAPRPHQPRPILPSSLNVRQKADVTTLCTLWRQPYTDRNAQLLTQSTYFPRDETGLVCLPTQLERTLELYW